MGHPRIDPNIYRWEDDILYITCTKCKIENKAENKYYGSRKAGKGSKYGFNTICKSCYREQRKSWKRYTENTKESYMKKRRSQRIKQRDYAVYKVVDRYGSILYVGKTYNVKERVKDHLGVNIYKNMASALKGKSSQIHKIFVKYYANGQENNACEMYYIAKYKPLYNKRDTMAGEPSKWLQPLAESVEWEEYDLNSLIKVEK